MDIQFHQLGLLHWFWLILALGVLARVGAGLRRRRLRRFADDSLLSHLIPNFSPAKAAFRSVLVLAAMGALLTGMIDPRWGTEYEEVQQQGIDLIFCLDLSKSMLAEDATPSRLVRAKQFISDIVEELGGDRVGLVGFAGVPTLDCPLTIDYGAFRLSLNELDPMLMPRGGSMIGDAIRLAAEAFTDDVKDHKAIVVFSDGEDHGSYPLQAAQSIWEDLGIRVYTVGVGDATEGARVPVIQNGRKSYMIHDGEQVWSIMQPDVLREIALIAGGAYVPVGTSNIDIARVFDEKIAPATKRQFDTTRIQRFKTQYQWFAGLALALLMMESMMTSRKSSAAMRRNPMEVYI